MSIQSEIERISDNVAAAYAAVEEMGGTVPEAQNSDGLAEAVRSIPTGGGIPSGCILIWSGAESAIPSGWALCDGENGTPDLRDRFVLGAGSHAVSETGGEETHTLTTAEIPSHSHCQCIGKSDGNTYFWASYISSGSSSLKGWATCYPSVSVKTTFSSYSDLRTSNSGSGKSHNNMPPYYALCYIMKL